MFKILNLILVSALILIVSIACSSATEHTHDGRYLTTADFDYQVQKYNELLTYTSELEERISNLENSTASSAAPSDIENKLASKVDLIDYNKFVSDYNQLVNYVNNLPKGSSSSKSQASVGNLDANLLRQIMCVTAQNYQDINSLDPYIHGIYDSPNNYIYLRNWQAVNCGTILGAENGTADQRLKAIFGKSAATIKAITNHTIDYWWLR